MVICNVFTNNDQKMDSKLDPRAIATISEPFHFIPLLLLLFFLHKRLKFMHPDTLVMALTS